MAFNSLLQLRNRDLLSLPRALTEDISPALVSTVRFASNDCSLARLTLFTFLGYGPPPPPTASPGPGKGRGRAPPGPATPQQTHQLNYPAPGASPQIPRPTPTGQLVRERPGNTLANWNPDDLPASQKREGPDWYAVFNPEVQRVLDVELVHHLVHDSVVCCVRFSRDGKYVATGCNRSAQIFDVATGQNVATLQDESVDKDGDLYIRSVCFSPDGKYLATGAEDKQIRVSSWSRVSILHKC